MASRGRGSGAGTRRTSGSRGPQSSGRPRAALGFGGPSNKREHPQGRSSSNGAQKRTVSAVDSTERRCCLPTGTQRLIGGSASQNSSRALALGLFCVCVVLSARLEGGGGGGRGGEEIPRGARAAEPPHEPRTPLLPGWAPSMSLRLGVADHRRVF
eukprot:COSAG02_NODE_2425_length_8891_cov_48.519791_8_plen_156_part_00